VVVSSATRVWASFDHYQVNLSSGELLRSGERVPMQEQPFQILRLLLEGEGRVVTREQLRLALWPEAGRPAIPPHVSSLSQINDILFTHRSLANRVYSSRLRKPEK
jgi:DNA-binding winged helix-turn-helix (wHTH) protein